LRDDFADDIAGRQAEDDTATVDRDVARRGMRDTAALRER